MINICPFTAIPPVVTSFDLSESHTIAFAKEFESERAWKKPRPHHQHDQHLSVHGIPLPPLLSNVWTQLFISAMLHTENDPFIKCQFAARNWLKVPDS